MNDEVDENNLLHNPDEDVVKVLVEKKQEYAVVYREVFHMVRRLNVILAENYEHMQRTVIESTIYQGSCLNYF